MLFEVTERTIVRGQLLTLPEIEVASYRLSLKQLEAREMIGLDHDRIERPRGRLHGWVFRGLWLAAERPQCFPCRESAQPQPALQRAAGEAAPLVRTLAATAG